MPFRCMVICDVDCSSVCWWDLPLAGCWGGLEDDVADVPVALAVAPSRDPIRLLRKRCPRVMVGRDGCFCFAFSEIGMVEDVNHCSTFELLLLLPDTKEVRSLLLEEMEDDCGGPTLLLLFSTTPFDPKEGRRRGMLRVLSRVSRDSTRLPSACDVGLSTPLDYLPNTINRLMLFLFSLRGKT